MKDSVFDQFFRSSPQPMWIYDPSDLRFLAANEAASQRYGYSQEEFLRMTLRDIRPEEDLSAFDAFLKEGRADKGSPTVWRHRTKSGEILYVEVLSTNIDFEGCPARVAVLRNVSTEHALLAEREAIFDLSHDLMLTRRLDGRVLWLNRAFERVLGWTVDEAHGMVLENLVHPDDRERRDALVEAIRAEGGSRAWEARCRTKLGDYRWIQWTATADLQGDRIYMVGRDIHESKLLVDRLSRSQENLANAQRLANIGSWSYSVLRDTFSLSDEYYRIVGYEPGGFEPTWENCLACVHPDDRALVDSQEIEQISDSEPRELEVRILRPNGDVRIVRSLTSATQDRDGRVVRIEGTIEDITERKREQNQLLQVLTSARCLLWQAAVTDWGDGLDWVTEIRNEEAARSFLPLILSEGGSYSDAFYNAKLPDDRARMDALSTSAIREGLPGYLQEYRIRLESGDVRWLAEDVTIESQGEGRWQVTGVCTDVTDRKRAEEEMSRVLTSARCLLFQSDVIEEDGVLRWRNEIRNLEGASLFLPIHIPPGETYLTAYHQAKHPEDVQRMDRCSTAAIREGQPGYRQEYRVRVANGEIRWISEDVSIEPLEPGRWSLTGVCTDITETKRAEEDITQLLEAARCLLWQADVKEVEGQPFWDLTFRNLEAAQKLLPLKIPQGQTYTAAFQAAKLPEDAGKMRMQTMEELANTPGGYQQEFRVRTASGEIRWLSEDVTIEPLDGDVWRLTGVCMDITERKQTLEEMSQILASARCMLWQLDASQHGEYFRFGTDQHNTKPPNKESGLQIFGTDIPIGESYATFFYANRLPEDSERMDRECRQALIAGAPGYRQEFRVRGFDGEIYWISEDVIIEPLGEHKWRLTGVLTNITQRKEADEALRASEARYQRMVANVPGVVAQLLYSRDGSYRCIYVNAASREMFELEPEEILSSPSVILETVHPDERERFLADLARAAVVLEPWKWEGRCVLRSGEEKWIEVTWRPDLQPNGDVIWDCLLMDVTPRKKMEAMMLQAQNDLAAKIHDRTRDLRHANVALQTEIAERQQAQEELRESEARYRGIVEDQTEMICRFLMDGTFTFVNEAHCRYYGQRAEDLIGTSFIRFLSPEEAAWMYDFLAKLGPDNPVASYEIKSLSPEGEERWQYWTNRYISDEAGQFVCIQAVGRDITDQKLAEQAMMQAKEEAERANLAKSEFLSRMSHELRTPLNAILGFGQVLEKQNLAPLGKESVSHILKGGRHLLGLINEILDLSKVEAGKIETSIEPVALVDIVPASADLVSSLEQEFQVDVDVDIDKLRPYHVLADQQRLKQVLINLLSNGVKYNRPGGKVTVTCREMPDEKIRIEIRDTGSGIHPEDLQKLFVPFERLGAANSAIEGTGLGLALSQRLVRAMGGTLDVESTVGMGSNFWIELRKAPDPRERAGFAPAEPEEAQRAAWTGKRYSVLCIEDNLSNLRLLEVVLANRPEVILHSALQGSIGLSLARQLLPDLILLDLNLPDMSGKQVLEALRRSAVTKDIPVIVISADATSSQIEKLVASGANAYLTKPLDVAEFLGTLEEVLS